MSGAPPSPPQFSPFHKKRGAVNTIIPKIAQKSGALGIRMDIYVHGWDQWLRHQHPLW